MPSYALLVIKNTFYQLNCTQTTPIKEQNQLNYLKNGHSPTFTLEVENIYVFHLCKGKIHEE